jgi:hypothetical protein
MSSSRVLVVIAIAAMTAFGLSACNFVPPPRNAWEIDDQYGVPPGSVPPYLLKPNGVMTNGLLPAQPYDTGG